MSAKAPLPLDPPLIAPRGYRLTACPGCGLAWTFTADGDTAPRLCFGCRGADRWPTLRTPAPEHREPVEPTP